MSVGLLAEHHAWSLIVGGCSGQSKPYLSAMLAAAMLTDLRQNRG